MIGRKIVQQLNNLVVIIFLPLKPRPFDAVLERRRFLQRQTIGDVRKRLHRLLSLLLHGLFNEFGVGQVAVDVDGGRGEESLEGVSGPLQRVFDGVGKVFEGANGDGFLGRILRRTVRFGEVRNNNLHVAFGSERPGLE